MAQGRGALLALVVLICSQERGDVRAPPLLLLLPPGKPSVAVGVARRRDAEDLDVQVGGDLDAHACAVAYEIQKREDLTEKTEKRNFVKSEE